MAATRHCSWPPHGSRAPGSDRPQPPSLPSAPAAASAGRLPPFREAERGASGSGARAAAEVAAGGGAGWGDDRRLLVTADRPWRAGRAQRCGSAAGRQHLANNASRHCAGHRKQFCRRQTCCQCDGRASCPLSASTSTLHQALRKAKRGGSPLHVLNTRAITRKGRPDIGRPAARSDSAATVAATPLQG